MKEKEHLPLYGVGPLYGMVIILMTVAGMLLSHIGILHNGKVERFKLVFMILGAILIIYGLSVWLKAVFKVKVDKYIISNHLCQNGIYGSVRNPCYSGIMIMCTGLLLLAANWWLLILPFIYWLFMTVLIKQTEEKWLTAQYGQEYLDYCKQVNRCIPWFKRKK